MFTLDNLKILLQLTNSDIDSDALLELIMLKVKNSLLSELQVDCLNKKTELMALDLCVLQYHKINNASKNGVGDITVSASENFSTYKTII